MKVASPGLASLINALSGPFVTARDQPPAPGSNWLVRGWHSMRRLAGRCLEVLPKKTTSPIRLVRLILVILAWAFILFVAIEVFFFWLMLVLPFVLIFRRKGNPPPAQPGRPVGLGSASTAWVGVPPRPFESPDLVLSRLAAAPDPDPEPAIDSCSMCGGATTDAKTKCLYCGSPLPMIARRGWHPDPLGSGVRRWFDGSNWSEQTRLPD